MACVRGINQLRTFLHSSSYRAKPCSKMVYCSYSIFSGCTSPECEINGKINDRFSTRSHQTINVLQEKQNRFAANPVSFSYRSRSYQSTRGPEFKEIYKFKHITLTRLISSAKVYQTAITLVGSPLMMYLYSSGVISRQECVNFLGLTSFACLMLYIMSGFFRKIVCIIYLNEKSQTLEISHLTFWGRRQDMRLEVADIKPLTDTTETLSSTFLRLQTYSTGQTFYLFLKNGKVTDVDTFKSLLGI